MSQGSAGYNQGPGANTKFATLVRNIGGSDLHFQQVTNFNPGVWGYRAGEDGTPSLPSDARVLSLACVAGSSGATVVIDGGDEIPVPNGQSFSMTVEANLIDPTIVFTDTVTFIVQFVEGV